MFKQWDRWTTFLTVLLLFASAGTAWGQLGLGKHKDKEKEPAKSALGSDKAPELSDSDKKKLSEIEQRPEIRDEIETVWQEQQKHDMEFAYSINQSAHLESASGQLYNNPMLERYVNGIGQRLVPQDSPNLFSFKILLTPYPKAEALTTGTIYVSTGLISLLDNEAQLAYILGHEIAHIEKRHFYNEVKNEVLQRELNLEKEKSAERKRTIFTAVTAGLGAGLGGAFGGGRGAFNGGAIGLLGGYGASLLLIRSKTTTTEWSTVYENEADEAGFKYMLEQNYDVREVPRLYTHLDRVVTRDARVGLGFIGKPARVKERIVHIQSLLT